MDNIKDIFDIPEYYNDLSSEIDSYAIHSLLKTNPLAYMRTLFVEDNKAFYRLRDELILRGIGFRKEYQNNYLLGRHYDIRTIIIKTEHTNAYKNINFTMHGGANFIERFNIQSDLFFHNIPWEGILHFLPNASEAFLKKEFEREGFTFIPVDHYRAISIRDPQKGSQKNNKVHDVATQNNATQNHSKNTAYDYAKLDLPIEHYFEGHMFTHFINYCHKNKITKFSDLTLDKIDEYSNVKYARSKTVQVIKEIYHDTQRMYNPLAYELPDILEVYQDNRFKLLCQIAEKDYLDVLNDFYESDNVYENAFPFKTLQKWTQNIIDNLDQIIEERAERRKREQLESIVYDIQQHPNYKYLLSSSIQELASLFNIQDENLPEETLFLYDILGDTKYLTFLSRLLNLMHSLKSLKEMSHIIIEQLKPREQEVLKLRESMTLQEVGDILDVTRERVRQIERKATNRIIVHKPKAKIELYFRYYSEHSKLVSLEKFCHVFDLTDELEKIIIKKLLEKTDTVSYIDTIDRYINVDDYDVIATSLEKIDLTQSIIEIDQLRELIPADMMDELREVLDILIKSHGYLRVNDIYVKEKISIIDRINYLFEKHIHEPLRMDDDGYEYFKHLMNTIFGIPYDSGKRSAAARIADGQNIILVDNSTFFKHEAEYITPDFLARLQAIIDDILSTQPFADPRVIYEDFPDLVTQAKLYSPVHLYSIIQLYFSDQYEVGQGNTLYIYHSDAGVLNTEEILLNYLENNGHEVHFDKILSDLNWKTPKLVQLLERIDTAIQVKDKKIKTIKSFDFTAEELAILKEITEKELEKGFVFTEDLAFELAFNESLEPLIERTNLTDITTLSSVVKWLHKDVQGFQKMLYRTTSPIKSLEQAIALEYPEMISRAELIQYAQVKGYSEQKIATLPSTIVEENLFYPYTSTQFINANVIQFTDDVKESLRAYLDKQFTEKPYQSVFSMIGFSQELLPVSDYEWTEWLIHHLAEQVGYRKVIIQYQDYRYDKLLLVKEESHMKTLDELAYYIAKTEYQGRSHEEDFASYLARQNIIHNPRRLNHEIYHSPLFEFDAFGFYQLR